jgi:hypothetical protein
MNKNGSIPASIYTNDRARDHDFFRVFCKEVLRSCKQEFNDV